MSRPQPSAVLDPSVLVSAAIAIDAGRDSAARILVGLQTHDERVDALSPFENLRVTPRPPRTYAIGEATTLPPSALPAWR
jgi:hypothetical protein